MRKPRIHDLKFDNEGTSLIRSLAKKNDRVTLTIHTDPKGMQLLGLMSAALQRLNRVEKDIAKIKLKFAA